MTESIRKLSNINFQWTKTFYQNNLKTITELFVTFFKGYRCNFVNCNNQITQKKFLMGTGENKCQISQNDNLHMKFSEFYLA